MRARRAPTGEHCGFDRSPVAAPTKMSSISTPVETRRITSMANRRPLRDGIDQQLAQVERRAHGREEHGNHLPIEQAEQQRGREDFVETLQFAGAGKQDCRQHGQVGECSVPDGGENAGENESAEVGAREVIARAAPLGPHDGAASGSTFLFSLLCWERGWQLAVGGWLLAIAVARSQIVAPAGGGSDWKPGWVAEKVGRRISCSCVALDLFF